ncbi:50S ribosomal protein L30 [Enterobacteriaceae endosymbiont of Macroplea mutica]|uniref:50S ribosomal protein L30 n=1 Tax=unclassified Enterobacteriaceae TaxID=36866 RepID=UPI0014492CD5|nr:MULTISPECIES: 50S ribosomal protein L30 [unclassified Enterobacteriaceae]QJC30869.1 50S ribosomal protein L30 [Enterobacteriaceae endosymbiont of Macroplea appendiculata]QJC31282.1 50S ribosomal protein L30 [Enterobacteriaceae endosymbiont of Macroplea mutica]
MLKNIYITQTKSAIGRLPKHKRILVSLGLKYIGHTVTKKNTPIILGMIRKISYMLKVSN